MTKVHILMILVMSESPLGWKTNGYLLCGKIFVSENKHPDN